MIEELLPAPVAAAEAFDDPEAALKGLYPQEEAAIALAVPDRRSEFATARWCARRAMGALGLPPVPLLSSTRGAPQWPVGVVGSMTHCAGYRAAAVSRSADFMALGIDAEPNGPLPAGILEVISLERERAWVRALGSARRQVHWDRVLFSAKESVFKVWYPLTRRELDFNEAEIEIEPDAGTFSARLLVPAPEVAGNALEAIAGRWMCREDLVITAIALHRPAGQRPWTHRSSSAHAFPGSSSPPT
ncbi:4'-phosphopantetheinyl transferase family protein [Wenjunlia tyrosinilytica]|uniref:4'-phosphopantetheinyl transferase n=1 Tax=Wenjunlia tyrosinilytica TaxID=1544741 RepID=A0A917ZXG8_9ACTN|nr:4'-phosphopantetheinyl transferase superfamily protein [Wenjunlia tyrosinilytica]GGO99505.1 4'-phosphopantetheinyl transferase [Wenjunlia tyrosinilytica]